MPLFNTAPTVMRRRIIISLNLLALLWRATALQAGPLEAGFQSPPQSAKAQTWWHWMNGNITKEGITADLEAMKQAGLGGAEIFNVDCDIPAGPVKFNGPEWHALFTHAVREADRLGLELCVHNGAGWSSSGGPWNHARTRNAARRHQRKARSWPVSFDGACLNLRPSSVSIATSPPSPLPRMPKPIPLTIWTPKTASAATS